MSEYERLTTVFRYDTTLEKCKKCECLMKREPWFCCRDMPCKGARKAINRLAAYEDSGLSPEEVAELAKIVRCKDCFQYSQNTEYDEDWGGYCHKYDADKNDNDCCRYAEKKGEKNV